MIPNKIEHVMIIEALLFSGLEKLGFAPDGGWSAGMYLYKLGSNILIEDSGKDMGEKYDNRGCRRDATNQGIVKVLKWS